MALAAIFVAAEHYGGLKQAEADLKRQRNMIGVLLSAEGLAKFRADVYDAYGRAQTRIDAVVRVFDTDLVWWKQGTQDPWTGYKKSRERTLYTALTRQQTGGGARGSVALKWAFPPAPRTDKVQFVVEMPWPPTRFFEEPQVPVSQAKRFDDLLGLAWRLVVLQHVRAERRRQRDNPQTPVVDADRFPYVRVVIAHCPSWMHAVDETVFQILESEKLEESSVRVLGREQDAFNRHRLGEWAHEDIRRHARRGCEAEGYVCSLFPVCRHEGGILN